MQNVILLNVIMLSVIMLSVIMLGVIMLSVIMLSVIMLSVIMLSVIMLSVVVPEVKTLCQLWVFLTGQALSEEQTEAIRNLGGNWQNFLRTTYDLNLGKDGLSWE